MFILVKRCLLVFSLSLIFVLLNKSGFSQDILEKEEMEHLEKMKSSDWQQRATGLSYFTKFGMIQDEDPGLSSSLKNKYMDNQRVIDEIYELADYEIAHDTPPGEPYAEYQCQLFFVLGNLNSERSIPYLLNHKRGCVGASRKLKNLGEPVVEPALKDLRENYPGRNVGTTEILVQLLKAKNPKYPLCKASKEKIKKALIECSKSGSDSVRIRAARGLGELALQGYTDVIPIIKKLAKEDPYFEDLSKRKNRIGPKIRYRVREHAQKVLDKLKKEGKIKE